MKHLFTNPDAHEIICRMDLPERVVPGDIMDFNGLWRVVQCVFHKIEGAIIAPNNIEWELVCAIIKLDVPGEEEA